jgi:hypothetical protein
MSAHAPEFTKPITVPKVFWWTLVLGAAPAVLASSVDVYLLTLFSSQTLFSSLAHVGGPVLFFLFVLSGLYFGVLAAANLAAILFLALSGSRSRLSLYSFLLAFQIFHVLAIAFYPYWAEAPVTRISVALLGLASLLLVVRALLLPESKWALKVSPTGA